MIRIEAFVDDKKIATVLHRLSGLVMNLQVVPVLNAKSKNGKAVEAGDHQTGTQVMRAIIGAAVKAKKKEIKRSEIMVYAKQHDYPATRLATALVAVTNAGALRRKSKGVYSFTPRTGAYLNG